MNSTISNFSAELPTDALYVHCRQHDVLATFSPSAVRYYIALICASILGAITTVLANAIFIAAMMIRRRITIGQKMLMILSAVDLTQGLSIAPLKACFHRLQLHGVIDCLLLDVILHTGFALVWTAVVAILLIAIEQYLALAYSYMHERSVTFSRLVFALLLPALVNVVCGLVLNLLLKEKVYWGLYKVCLGAGAGLLGIVIVIIQGRVVCIAINTRKEIGRHNPAEAVAIRKRAKAMKTSLLIILAFTIAYAPLAVYTAYTFISKDASLVQRTYVKPVVELVALSNSVVNPFVYYWRSQFIRKAVKQFLCRQSSRVVVTY